MDSTNSSDVAARVAEAFNRLRERDAAAGESGPGRAIPAPQQLPCGWYVPDESWMWEVGRWEVPPLCGMLDLDAFDEHGNWREGKRPADWPHDA